MFAQVMLSAVSTKTYPALKKDKEQQRQRTANCIAVAVTALAGLAPLAKRGRSSSEGIDKVRSHWGMQAQILHTSLHKMTAQQQH